MYKETRGAGGCDVVCSQARRCKDGDQGDGVRSDVGHSGAQGSRF